MREGAFPLPSVNTGGHKYDRWLTRAIALEKQLKNQQINTGKVDTNNLHTVVIVHCCHCHYFYLATTPYQPTIKSATTMDPEKTLDEELCRELNYNHGLSSEKVDKVVKKLANNRRIGGTKDEKLKAISKLETNKEMVIGHMQTNSKKKLASDFRFLSLILF